MGYTNTQDATIGFVTGRFAQSTNYASAAWTSFSAAITLLQQDFSTDVPPPIEVTFSTDPPTLDYDIISTKPAAPKIDYDAPASLSGPELRNESYTVGSVIPTFTTSAPVVELPATPSTDLPTDPGEPPPIGSISLPTAPVISLPAVPTLKDIIFASPPDLDTLQFSVEMPVSTLIAPVAAFVYSEEAYLSVLKDPLDTKILADIVAGGTGLAPDVEDAIYNRARSRFSQERGVQYVEATNYFASRGHSLPPGALQARITEIDRRFNNSLDDVNRDIVVKQAELTWQNIKETITAGMNRENTLMQHANAVAQRAFDSAKFEVESILAIFSAEVALYNTRLDAYKTEAMIFTERVKAQLAQVEVFKAQIESSKVEASVQQILVEIYNSKLAGVLAGVEVYNAQLRGASIQVDLEKLRLEGYQATIVAYQSKLQAKTAEYNIFQAQVSGEVAKVSIFTEEVNAFAEQNNAYTAEINRVATLY